nr:crotonase/enoyl-CoA hydratase family protein [uncultured Flavobacterium sp.]
MNPHKSMNIKKNVNIEIDYQNKILWLEIGSYDELYYSYETICNFHDSLENIKNVIETEKLTHVFFKSPNKKVWSMGGDLEMFLNCINNNDVNQLKDYAYKCVKSVHEINNGFRTNAIVVAVVEGNAFGGGFECALSTHYIIAEEHVKFSFPESLFGTFPGMGAYSFLTRKVGFFKAEEMINSSQKWDTSEMYNLSLINHIAKTQNGIKEALELKSKNAFIRKNQFETVCSNLKVDELLEIVDIWIHQVMSLGTDKIDFMRKLIDAQKKRVLPLD